MLRTSSPSDRVISVELDPGSSLLLIDDLQSIVVDEHVGGPPLEFIRRDGLFDRFDRGSND